MMKAQVFFSRDLLRALSQNTTELTTRPKARIVAVFFNAFASPCVQKRRQYLSEHGFRHPPTPDTSTKSDW